MTNEDRCDKTMTDEDCCDKLMTDLERCDKSITDEDCCDKLMTDNEDRFDKPMTDEDRKRCVTVFASVVTFGIYIYILIKVLSPHLYIQQLHIREDFSNSSNPNTSIVMDINFKCPLLSDELNITLYCASSYQSFSPIGYSVVPGFTDGLMTAHREAVVVLHGPSWDDARRKLAQGSTVELRVEMNTSFIYREKCRHCSDIMEREKCHCSGCRDVTPVQVVADFLLDGSGEVKRIS